ncbi:uncharacterized protein F5147DRAFT_748794 [Suillus discolor]|uniref:Helitron helicase-like domain-containing protein n=1 Tax=Suillus discolor TaxID=1912936 RepID=A0A9P7ES14_9AGAM|nr:uncharacterized protein F5147DRAFT_748794 [Suillus discolor]KAG2084532.1 hypothetical protein F5147DRAFT_748794 [Suillus discolor]
MSSFERAKAFLNIILKYKHGPGIFGHCQAYYGMVEAQGRGTLHCHMLLWIAGNPSPQALRDRLASDASFKSNMFQWLENIISCKLPYDKGPVPETSPNDACKPVRTHELDPRLERSPQVAEMDAKSFEYEFKKFLSRLAVECNWHIHSETCYKHLKNGQKKGDSTCRMRLDGSVQDVTTIDIETGSIELRRWRGRCNTDTQFIGSGEAVKAAVFYITEYITKGDLPLHVALQALEYAPKMHNAKYITDPQVDPQKKDSNLLTKSVNAMMGWQEMSHQQVMSYLIGGGDYYTSHTFETIKWYEFCANEVVRLCRVLNSLHNIVNVETQLDIDALHDVLLSNPALDGDEFDDDVTGSQLNENADITSVYYKPELTQGR